MLEYLVTGIIMPDILNQNSEQDLYYTAVMSTSEYSDISLSSYGWHLSTQQLQTTREP